MRYTSTDAYAINLYTSPCFIAVALPGLEHLAGLEAGWQGHPCYVRKVPAGSFSHSCSVVQKLLWLWSAHLPSSRLLAMLCNQISWIRCSKYVYTNKIRSHFTLQSGLRSISSLLQKKQAKHKYWSRSSHCAGLPGSTQYTCGT